MTHPDSAMEPMSQFGQAAFSLGVVIALLLGVAWIVQRVQGRKLFGNQALLDPSLKMKIESTLYLDPKTRLVLVRRGAVGHLICLGTQGAQVVEQGIALPDHPEPIPKPPSES